MAENEPLPVDAQGWSVLPCGCRMKSTETTFMFQPCALDCEFYAFVVAEGERQGKPTTTIYMREAWREHDTR